MSVKYVNYVVSFDYPMILSMLLPHVFCNFLQYLQQMRKEKVTTQILVSSPSYAPVTMQNPFSLLFLHPLTDTSGLRKNSGFLFILIALSNSFLGTTFYFNMILFLHPSQDKRSINCSFLRHKAKLHFIISQYSTKTFL